MSDEKYNDVLVLIKALDTLAVSNDPDLIIRFMIALNHLAADNYMAGLEADLPDFQYFGRTYFCTDSKKVFFDTGLAWEDRTPGSGGAPPSGFTADVVITGVGTLTFVDGVLTGFTPA